MITPTMHRPIPMNTRVVVPASYGTAANAHGTVVGIAHVHPTEADSSRESPSLSSTRWLDSWRPRPRLLRGVFFSYIVLLDVPIDIGHGLMSAICVSGCELRGIDGESWLVNS